MRGLGHATRHGTMCRSLIRLGGDRRDKELKFTPFVGCVSMRNKDMGEHNSTPLGDDEAMGRYCEGEGQTLWIRAPQWKSDWKGLDMHESCR